MTLPIKHNILRSTLKYTKLISFFSQSKTQNAKVETFDTWVYIQLSSLEYSYDKGHQNIQIFNTAIKSFDGGH